MAKDTTREQTEPIAEADVTVAAPGKVRTIDVSLAARAVDGDNPGDENISAIAIKS